MKLHEIHKAKTEVSAEQRKLYNAIVKAIAKTVKMANSNALGQAGPTDINPEYLTRIGNGLKAAALGGKDDFEKDWSKLASRHTDLFAHLADEIFSELGVDTYDEMMTKLKQLKEADETDVDAPEAKDDELEADKNAAEATPSPQEDVGSVSQAEGFKKSKKEMFAFGATRPVTLLTKDEKIGGMDITLQYVINPKTGAWSLRAALQGQSAEDMVEFETGEDPTSLIKNLKKKKKITPHQLVDNLNPPADKIGAKKPPAPVPTSTPEKPEDDEEESIDEAVKSKLSKDMISKELRRGIMMAWNAIGHDLLDALGEDADNELIMDSVATTDMMHSYGSPEASKELRKLFDDYGVAAVHKLLSKEIHLN